MGRYGSIMGLTGSDEVLSSQTCKELKH